VIPLIDFVLAHLPDRPARVLEVGCGDGDLARALAATGYDVTAIDPVAPEGPIFRRIKLEDLEENTSFDAVVASQSFHHMANLDQNLDRVARLLGEDGRLILDEFAWERLDEPTADWYEGQRRVLVAALEHRHAPTAEDWLDNHAEVHRSETVRTALSHRFEELAFERVPYLWRYLGGPVSAELEELLIGSGAIQALGFRFVGIPARERALKRQ
jgi:ubiquinone/menaquinone biosynthesis C-methylase UbiE